MLEPTVLDPRIEQVETWRLKQLLEAGYPVDLAEPLAARSDIDLHQACQLADCCPPELAARILL